jgi:hypothetical protein
VHLQIDLLSAHAGVLFYATDDIEIPLVDETIGYNVTQIPLQVGGKYYLSEQKEGLFVSALLGVHITSYSQDSYTIEIFGQEETIPEASDSETNFSFAPEVGYFLNENISLSARYQIISGDFSDWSYLGLRAAYNF